MVRTYKRKTDRAFRSETNMLSAIRDVLEGRLSVRNAAEAYNLKKSTLGNRVKNIKKRKIRENEGREQEDANEEELRTCDNDDLTEPRDVPFVSAINRPFQSKYSSQQVFSSGQEKLLCDYLLQSSKINYGLTYSQSRKLAFEYAKKLNRKYPTAWDKNEKAGIDWMKSFMTRFPNLALRKPENTSLARATGFNETNVTQFFDNLENAVRKYKIPPEKIYNLDETGVSTVLQAPKVIAATGVKQVGQTVSAERGELVTFCAIINSLGNTVPPVYIFPRAKYKSIFLKGSPTGSLGLANRSGSGWMTTTLFLEVMKHIQKFTRCTKDEPILIVLDNHESHTSLETILFCGENGIHFVTFPPHCTHRMQPLDVGLYRPFKTYLKVAFNDWLLGNPGKRISIYEIAELSGKAYHRAFTMDNICSAFKKCGIVPLNRQVFNRDDYAAAYVTDQKPPSSNNQTSNNRNDQPSTSFQTPPPNNVEDNNSNDQPSTSFQTPRPICNTSTAIITPESIQPFPKAQRKLPTSKGRKFGKSRILTETPEKDRLEQERREKEKGKGKRDVFPSEEVKKSIAEKKTLKDAQKKEKPQKNLQNYSDDSDISESGDLVLNDSESDCISEFSKDNSDDEFMEQVIPLQDPETMMPNIFPGDYLLVKYASKKVIKFFVGEVEKIVDGQYQINFLRKKNKGFVFPIVVDKDLIDFDQIERKLPKPKDQTTTARARSIKKFSVGLSGYNIN